MESGRRWYLHPFLFALFPVLAMYEFNADELIWQDAVLPAAAVLAATGALMVALRFIVGGWERAAAIAALWMLMFLSYGHLEKVGNDLFEAVVGSRLRHRYVIPIWGLSLIAVTVWIGRRRQDFPKVTTLLNFVAGILVALSLVRIATYQMQTRIAFEEVAANDANSDDPSNDDAKLTPPSDPPDVWYLVFDRYGGRGVLEEWYDYDNGPFLTGLEERGFIVDDDAFANYPKTLLSMCSALTMQYHGATAEDKSTYRARLENYRASVLLKEAGYAYYHFGSWHQPLRSAPNADEVFSYQLLPSEFSMVLYQQTPVMPLVARGGKRREIHAKFAALVEVAARPGPKYVFAHFICPHPPYVFGRDGGSVDAGADERGRYRDQLHYLNQLIEEFVDDLLESSKRPPIIILTADEGPTVYEEDGQFGDSLQLDADTVRKINKRSRILFAAHLPDGHEDAFQGVHTPVNHFRAIFNAYFDAGLEILPERTYFWPRPSPRGEPASMSEPFDFVDVTQHVAP